MFNVKNGLMFQKKKKSTNKAGVSFAKSLYCKWIFKKLTQT